MVLKTIVSQETLMMWIICLKWIDIKTCLCTHKQINHGKYYLIINTSFMLKVAPCVFIGQLLYIFWLWMSFFKPKISHKLVSFAGWCLSGKRENEDVDRGVHCDLNTQQALQRCGLYKFCNLGGFMSQPILLQMFVNYWD